MYNYYITYNNLNIIILYNMTTKSCGINTIVGCRFEPPSSLSFDWAEFLKSTSDLTRGYTFHTNNNTSLGFTRSKSEHYGGCSIEDEYVIQPVNSKDKFYLNSGEHCLDDCSKNEKCTGVSYNYENNKCYLLKKCNFIDNDTLHNVHFIKKQNY